MVNLIEKPEEEKLLPPGHHYREAAFWTMTIIFDLAALYTASITFWLQQWVVGGLALIAAIVITDVAIRFHHHNHDHLFLLAAATVIGVIFAALWSVNYWSQLWS